MVVVYSKHGQPRWLTLGKTDKVGLADARKNAAKILLAAVEGGDPQAEKIAERHKDTFGDLATRYVEEFAKKRNKSWAQADRLVRRLAIPKWGKLKAASITRSDVRKLMGSISAPVVANQTLAALSAIFTWGIGQELLSTNPCSKVERNETRARERVLAEGELPLFWRAFDDAPTEVGAALRVLLLTGQRPGEVSHMRFEHLVAGGGGTWWEMPGQPDEKTGWPGTKNGENHRIWVPSAAMAIINQLHDGEKRATGFVFRGPRGAPTGALGTAMQAACVKLGAPRATPHDLRRTHGTTITALKFGRHLMNRVQNHKEGGMGDIYDRHDYAADIKQVMETVASRIMALVEGREDDSSKLLVFPRH